MSSRRPVILLIFTRVRPHTRSEEHTSELQSHHELVCRLLLEKKNTNTAASPRLPRDEGRSESPPYLTSNRATSAPRSHAGLGAVPTRPPRRAARARPHHRLVP